MGRLHRLLSRRKVLDSLCKRVVLVADVRRNNGDKELDLGEPEQAQIRFQKGKTALVVVSCCTNLGVIIMFFCLHVHTLTIFSQNHRVSPRPSSPLCFSTPVQSALCGCLVSLPAHQAEAGASRVGLRG